MENKSVYIARMAENLPVLRAKSGLTQAELADVVGVSRQTILSVEKKQRDLTWSMFLALLNVFGSNEKTAALIDTLEIRPKEYQINANRLDDSALKKGNGNHSESNNYDQVISEMFMEIKKLKEQLIMVSDKLTEFEIEHSRLKEELIMAMNKITSQDELIEKIMKNQNIH